MKHFRTIICMCVITAMLMAMAGCGDRTFAFTMAGSKTTIEVEDAVDGATADFEAIDVGKKRLINITSSLEEGQLQIEFIEAVNIKADVDDPDDYVLGDVAETVTVGPGDEETFSLDRGEYVLRVTAVGETDGEVVVKIEKKK